MDQLIRNATRNSAVEGVLLAGALTYLRVPPAAAAGIGYLQSRGTFDNYIPRVGDRITVTKTASFSRTYDSGIENLRVITRIYRANGGVLTFRNGY